MKMSIALASSLLCIAAMFSGCSQYKTSEQYVARPQAEPLIPVTEPTQYEQNDINYSISVNYPLYGIPELDGSIFSDITKCADDFRSRAERNESYETFYSLTGNYEVFSAFDRLYTIKLNLFEKTNSMKALVFVYHYDAVRSEMIEDSDVFAPGQEYLDMLSAQTAAALEKNYPDLSLNRVEEMTAARSVNFQNYAFTDTGILVFFPPKESQSFDEPQISVEIPYRDLRGAFSQGYPFS